MRDLSPALPKIAEMRTDAGRIIGSTTVLEQYQLFGAAFR